MGSERRDLIVKIWLLIIIPYNWTSHRKRFPVQIFVNCAQSRRTRGTHAWEFDTTVTALWRSTLLLDVQVSEATTGSLDNADLVRPGVVPDYRE